VRVGETRDADCGAGHRVRWRAEAGAQYRIVVSGDRDEDFRISIVAPGDQLIHDLPAADGRVAGSSLQWHIEQPWLLFALSIKLAVGSVRNEAALALPLDIRFDG